MPKAGYTSYSDEKYHSTFATILREELIPTPEKARELANYLGVSIQAVNQYKQGQGFPKTENLVKIAQYFNRSLDNLIGLSDVSTPEANIQAIAEYTGLSEAAIQSFHVMNPEYKKAIMPLLEDNTLERAGGFISFAIRSIAKADPKSKSLWMFTTIGDENTSFNEDGTITTIFSPKSAAKQFIKDAQETLSDAIDVIAAKLWNEREG